MNLSQSEYNAILSEQFGEHHWALLAKIEEACYARGSATTTLASRHLRINPHLHPTYANSEHRFWNADSGSRLAEFRRPSSMFNTEQALREKQLLPGHDDISCLLDLKHAKFLQMRTDNLLCVTLTAEGFVHAALYRKFVIEGNRPCMFSLANSD